MRGLIDRLGLARALVQQPEIVGDVGTFRVLGLGCQEHAAGAPVVAAQHVGKALVVHDLGRCPDDLDGLGIGAVGEIEALEPVVGRGEADPGFGVARMQLDRLAEMPFRQAVAALQEVFLAEAQIVIIADSISGSRPGARSPQDAVHLAKLAKLENLAKTMLGVERAFAYDSGRELRVFVHPDKIDDLGAARLAKQVARKVKAEAEYPGPVKVTVIRETRAIEVSE